MTEAEIQLELNIRYEEIINLGMMREWQEQNPKLSGVFLPSISQAYLDSSLRLMIVGRETKGWGRGISHASQFNTSKEYIEYMIRRHASQFERPAKKSKFFQFYHEASSYLHGKGSGVHAPIIWGNLFCVSHNESSPQKLDGKLLRDIIYTSQKLLQSQIEILQPQIVLFTTGPDYDRYIKEYFEIKKSHVIERKRLWRFETPRFIAYRTNHPRCAVGKEYRTNALKLINGLKSGHDFTNIPA